MTDQHAGASESGATYSPRLHSLVEAIRAVLAREPDERRVARRVGQLLAERSLDDLLTPDQRRPDPRHLAHHVVHAEADGSFSIVAIVWLPGQATVVHDHLCWCVVAVVEGEELETNYELASTGDRVLLAPTETRVNATGSVTVLLPPGDIHRVENAWSAPTVSVHVYGANIAELATSIRRCYTE